MRTRKLTGTLFVSKDHLIFKSDNPDYNEIKIPRLLVTGKLVDRDSVEVDVSKTDRQAKVKVHSVRVLARDREIIGIVNKNRRVTPLHEIGQEEVMLLPAGQAAGNKSLKSDDIIVVKLLAPRKGDSIVCGNLIKILDSDQEINLEIEIVLRAFGIPHCWDNDTLAESSTISKISPSECLEGREDLRSVDFVTIDGESAKDFDDAIFCEPQKNGWNVSVAIADVAHYVRADSALDKAAAERGNSIYFPNYVVPMLPSELSDDLCSLCPHQDRLALVCNFYVSSQGEMGAYRFSLALIRSKARLTYTEVSKFFTGEDKLSKYSDNIRNMLMAARQVFVRLFEQRKIRGALELDVHETQLIYNKRGNVQTIVPVVRNDAHRLIEEFMIGANVCAAQFLSKSRKVLPYRVHGGLKENIFEKFSEFFQERAITQTALNPRGLSALLAASKDSGDSRIIHSLILRFLSKALYQTDNIGHFGLALDQYTHFTSPIRRYSDLIVHRILHRVLKSDAGKDYKKVYLDKLGAHLCVTERRANEVAYNIEKYLKCVYVDKHVGESFSGVVISVVSFGLFVMLDGIYVEGLLHISALGNDYYEFDESRQCLIGKRSKRTYTLGDNVSVTLDAVNPEARKIDLVLA